TRGAGIVGVSGRRLVGVVGYGGVEQKMWEKGMRLEGEALQESWLWRGEGLQVSGYGLSEN
nr:hypothetical protein [Tanacetum cinerariifolium]